MEMLCPREKPAYEAIQAFMREEWPEQWGPPTDEGMRKAYKESADERLDVHGFLVSDGRNIGWYRYSPWPRNEVGTRTAHTLDIALLPEFRRQGLGRLLMEGLIEDCRRRGFDRILSRTFADNAPSIRLHEACGFSLRERKGESLVWELSLDEEDAGGKRRSQAPSQG